MPDIPQHGSIPQFVVQRKHESVAIVVAGLGDSNGGWQRGLRTGCAAAG
jgi:hypothetical protein